MVPPVCWYMRGHVEPLGNGGLFDGTADGGVPGHGSVNVALGHGFGRDVVADDGQRALLAQHAVGVFVRALDYVFKAASDAELDQLGENGAHGVVVAVGVEVVVDFEIGRGRFLHGLGLGDDVLHFIDVVLDPVIAASGSLAHFFGHGVRGLGHGPSGDRNPRADLGADQLPRGDTEVLAH